MTTVDTIERVKSGVLNINFISPQNKLLAKGSGFMCNGFLVTNNHVFQGPQDSRVWIRAHNTSDTDLSQGIILNREDFRNTLRSGSDEGNHDYAILEIPQLQTLNLYNFTLCAPVNLRMGEDICFLGYPLEHMNLTCNKGIVSSFFTSNNVQFIQIDASVNSSNSGGPLFNPDTGEVLGIITRKATGFTRMMDQLKASVESNIQIVQAARRSGARSIIGGVDQNAAVEASQIQMLGVIKEIERSANVGIGYAVSSEHLLEDHIFQNL